MADTAWLCPYGRQIFGEKYSCGEGLLFGRGGDVGDDEVDIGQTGDEGFVRFLKFADVFEGYAAVHVSEECLNFGDCHPCPVGDSGGAAAHIVGGDVGEATGENIAEDLCAFFNHAADAVGCHAFFVQDLPAV